MIELAKHIEILLLENDCVIVPGFGGFIAHYQPAHYSEDENLYLPPIRTIGFNPQLKINDGLLVQAYMQAYHTDFPDATRLIENKVAELKEKVDKEGVVELHGIGSIQCNIHHAYTFQPMNAGALSPALYGLGSFSIRRLEAMHMELSAPTRELLPRTQRNEKIRRLGRQWLGNAVAVAVAVVLFFFLSVPVENTYVDKGNYASLGASGLFDAIRSQSWATTQVALPDAPQHPQKNGKGNTAIRNNQNTLKPVAVKVEKVAKEEKPAVTKPVEKPATTQPAPKTAAPAKQPETTQTATPAKAKGYCIIVSSLANDRDAQQALKEYKQQGYNGAFVIEGNGRYRLALYRFDDQAAAYKKLNELKKESAFKNAWVLRSK